jgi:hypothetical protein
MELNRLDSSLQETTVIDKNRKKSNCMTLKFSLLMVIVGLTFLLIVAKRPEVLAFLTPHVLTHLAEVVNHWTKEPSYAGTCSNLNLTTFKTVIDTVNINYTIYRKCSAMLHKK